MWLRTTDNLLITTESCRPIKPWVPSRWKEYLAVVLRKKDIDTDMTVTKREHRDPRDIYKEHNTENIILLFHLLKKSCSIMNSETGKSVKSVPELAFWSKTQRVVCKTGSLVEFQIRHPRKNLPLICPKGSRGLEWKLRMWKMFHHVGIGEGKREEKSCWTNLLKSGMRRQARSMG